MGTRSTGDQLEEVLIASRATDEDIEAGLLNSNSHVADSQDNTASQMQRPPKRNVSGLGQRLMESFKGQSETPAPAPARTPLTAHPSPPKSAMKKSAGTEQPAQPVATDLTDQSSCAVTVAPRVFKCL